VANYMDFNREDSDEEKKAALAGVVSIGEQVGGCVRGVGVGVEGLARCAAGWQVAAGAHAAQSGRRRAAE
jgi:hypothetical protein